MEVVGEAVSGWGGLLSHTPKNKAALSKKAVKLIKVPLKGDLRDSSTVTPFDPKRTNGFEVVYPCGLPLSS